MDDETVGLLQHRLPGYSNKVIAMGNPHCTNKGDETGCHGQLCVGGQPCSMVTTICPRL